MISSPPFVVSLGRDFKKALISEVVLLVLVATNFESLRLTTKFENGKPGSQVCEATMTVALRAPRLRAFSYYLVPVLSASLRASAKSFELTEITSVVTIILSYSLRDFY